MACRKSNIFVVDTNVGVVANGKSDMSQQCIEKCSRKLLEIMKGHCVAIDSNWLILKEYTSRLKSSGEPGIGDKFLKWILTNYTNPQKCSLVGITPTDSSRSDFMEVIDIEALKDFDPNDKKFIATAIAHPKKPSIIEASDSKWIELRGKLVSFGVSIIFPCEDELEVVYARKCHQ
jgi:hypothetical protein